jgi:hypothetical protein
MKLPVLYLVDSIVKNYGRAYTQLFTQNIVSSFCSVFEKVLFFARNGKQTNKTPNTHLSNFRHTNLHVKLLLTFISSLLPEIENKWSAFPSNPHIFMGSCMLCVNHLIKCF